jgi:ParB family chromosome partitioning protein
LAERAQQAQEIETRLLEGVVVVELDPDEIDPSFISDRMDDDEEAFNELLEAIREHGQASPILVRPHPEVEGRYMIVFGHRRHRAAKALQLKVRAVVKAMGDREHVVSQGQENSARADLSFIEKAVFASSLESQGYDRDVIMQALSVDKTVISKMLSVVNDIPTDVVHAIGPARNSGRDRWYKLAIKFREAGAAKSGARLINSDEFESSDSDGRLELLTSRLDKAAAKSRQKVAKLSSWTPTDQSVSVAVKSGPKDYTLRISKAEAKPFGEWISGNLDSLFAAYRQSKQEN